MHELIKAFSLFVYPLGFGIALLLLGVLMRWSGRARIGSGVVVLSLLWLWGWSMPWTSDALRAPLEGRYEHRLVEEVPKADAVVILGGAFRSEDNWPYPAVTGPVDRYWHGARLYHAGRAGRVLMSGGSRRPGIRTEAQSGAIFLMHMGVPEEHILLDNEARTTQQHVRHIAQLLDEQGLESFLLVTSAMHMRRAEAVFRADGLDPIPVATDFRVGENPPRGLRRVLPSATALGESTAAVHEYVGYWFYRVRGWV